MTYFDTAAARRTLKCLTRVAAIAGLSLALASCAETAGGLFGGSSASVTQDAPPPIAAAPQAVRARVAIAPIVGPTEQIGKTLTQQLTTALEKQRIAVVASKEQPSDYILRGYVVASKEKSVTKVSYIWDVTDPAGKRLNRITGEESVGETNRAVGDAWAVVGANVTQQIADRSSVSLAAWIPAGGVPTAGAAPAAVGGPGAPGATAALPTPVLTAPPPSPAPVPAVAIPTPAAPVVQPVATAPVPGGAAAASMPVVTGAPGDGNTALAAALQRELVASGAALVDSRGAPIKVEGRVVMGPPKDGKQTIAIDWRLRDSQGRALGTVSQKNEVPQGSLDGTWGGTADAAAAAAVQGILKLLPQRAAAN